MYALWALMLYVQYWYLVHIRLTKNENKERRKYLLRYIYLAIVLLYGWCWYNICLLHQSQVCNMFHRKLYWLGQDHGKLTLKVIVLFINDMKRIFILRCFLSTRISWSLDSISKKRKKGKMMSFKFGTLWFDSRYQIGKLDTSGDGGAVAQT